MFRRAVFLLPMVRARLRFTGYKKTQRWLQNRLHRTEATSSATSAQSAVELTCRMVSAAERYLPGQASCLEESLLLCHLLESQNIPSVVRIGVRKDGEKFEAHAWVEQDGIALNQHEERHRHYTPFESESRKPPVEEP